MKNRYLMKRIQSFLIDYLIVSLLVGLVSSNFRILERYDEYASKTLSYINEGGSDLKTIISYVEKMEDGYRLTYFIIVSVSLIYYVIIAKYMKNRTIGCLFTGLTIVKNNAKPSYSDLTSKMLLTNGVIVSLFGLVIYVVALDVIVSMMLFAFFAIIFAIFSVSNFIFLMIKGFSLVDLITKTRPVIVVRVK